MELFKSIAHIDVVHIAYKGASPALADLLGGQIPVMISNVPQLLPYVQAGKIRVLAVTSPKRVPQLASVPTMIESGYAGFNVTSWYGLCAPAGTPQAILDKVHTDLRESAAGAGPAAALRRSGGRSRTAKPRRIRRVHP